MLLSTMELAYGQMELQVSLTRATAAPFPTSAMAYYNNPMSYFSLTITPIDGTAHDVFLSMTLSSDATPTKIWTDDRFVGTMPKINIPSLGKKVGSTEFVQHFYRRLNTNLSETYRGVSDLTLPEGTYHLCIDVHDYYDTSRVIGSSCLHFDICYSGLAPEFSSPNLTPSTSGGYDKLVPAKKTNFSWTGVVSNCFEPNAFDYIIQFVEVYPNQNVQEAVESNPVLAALDCGRRLFFTFDYQTNPYLRLDSGGVYAAVVEAVPSEEGRVVNLSNDGKSQYMVFVWCGPNTSGSASSNKSKSSGGGSGSTIGNGDGVKDEKIIEKSNEKDVLKGLLGPQVLTPSNRAVVDNVNGPLSIDLKAVVGDSINAADYTIALYEYVGDTAVSLSRQPLKQIVLLGAEEHSGETLKAVKNWSKGLQVGNKYLITVKANVEYRYNTTYKIRKVDFIDMFPEINRYDSVVGMTAKTTKSCMSVFQWGTQGGGYMALTPAKITYPQQQDGGHTMRKSDLRVISWDGALFDGQESDLIMYDLYVNETNNNGEVGDKVYEKTGLNAKQLVVDEALSSKLKPGKSYMVSVKARLYYEAVGAGAISVPVRFVIDSSSNETSYIEEMYDSFFMDEDDEDIIWGKTAMNLKDDGYQKVILRGRTATYEAIVGAEPMNQPKRDTLRSVSFGVGGKDAKGNPRKVTGYMGFKSDRLVDAENSGKNKELSLSAQVDMFTLSGELKQLPSGGWGGPVKVALLDGVYATMNVAFGKSKDNNGEEYDWWYIYGGELYGEPLEVGALSVMGFGGVFAHNMSLVNNTILDRNVDELVRGSYSSVKLRPVKGGWVAKGGIKMSCESEEIFKADGIISLASENGHFSRIFIDLGRQVYSEAIKALDESPRADGQMRGYSVMAYELSRDCHLLNLWQLPAGVKSGFKHCGISNNGKGENLSPLMTTTVSDESGSDAHVTLKIETWRQDGNAQYAICATRGKRSQVKKTATTLIGAEMSGGKASMPDDYAFDKDLQSILPKVSKSAGRQAAEKTMMRSEVVAECATKGSSQLRMNAEYALAELAYAKPTKTTTEATLIGNVGQKVQFDKWNGYAPVAQSVVVSRIMHEGANTSLLSGYVDLQYNTLNNKTKIETESALALASDGTSKEEGMFAFDGDEYYKASGSQTSSVSPYSYCSFKTATPLTKSKSDGNADIKDILVAIPDGENGVGVRRFCFTLDENDSYVSTVGDMTQKEPLRLLYQNGFDNRVRIESASGGFVANDISRLNIRANVYEKRYGTGDFDDRTVDVATGREDLMMKADSIAWGYPLLNGKARKSTIDTTVYFRTNGSSLTLSNQVMFTWPYNGDPFVPNEEIDSSCYIVLRHDRDDLFVKENLEKVGKKLYVFVTNQEQGEKCAAECQYEYFSAKRADQILCDGSGVGMAYVRIDMPKSLIKQKSSAATYSPCLLSIYIVDKTEFEHAITEANSTVKEPAQQVSPISVCRSLGTKVYEFGFRLDHMYSTYKQLFDTIASESARFGEGIGYGATKVTLDKAKGLISSQLSSLNLNRFYAFRNRSYLFDTYSPNDTNLYAQGVVLPPLAVLAVNGRQSIDNRYNNHIPEWMAVSESFYYQFAHLFYFQSRAKWLWLKGRNVLYDPSIMVSDVSLLSPSSMRIYSHDGKYVSMTDEQFVTILQSGRTVESTSRYWFHEGSQMRVPYSWCVPAILNIRSNQVNRITPAHFSSTKHLNSATFVKDDPSIFLDDYVSAATMRDNKVFASFFSQLRTYAEWYASLSDEGRESVRNSFADSSLNNIKLSLSNSPFTMPKASLLTAYDSWSHSRSQFRSRDYWFDNWLRHNDVEEYQGIKPAWASPWISANYTPVNTEQYTQSRKRDEYRNYVANAYYLSCRADERSFLNTVFEFCRSSQSGVLLPLNHNSSADVRIAVHVPFNNIVREYIYPSIAF